VNGRRSRENRCRKWFNGPHRNEKLQTKYFHQLKHFSIISFTISKEDFDISDTELPGSSHRNLIAY
jgi:hypothetical protein